MTGVRTIDVTEEQIADVARSIARGYGNDDPDMMIVRGPLMVVFAPFGGDYYRAASSGAFPLWRMYEGAAKIAIGAAGRIAGVNFTLVTKREAA